MANGHHGKLHGKGGLLLLVRNLLRSGVPAAWQVFTAGVLLLAIANAAAAQTTSPTDGQTPPGLAPGAPPGSYALSGFENIDLYDGSLGFHLPLFHIGGRGGPSTDMTLISDQKWQIVTTPYNLAGALGTSFAPNPFWWQPLDTVVGYGPGFIEGRQAVEGLNTCSAAPAQGVTYPADSLTRLTFTAPDGTEYELRDAATDGQPFVYQVLASCISGGPVPPQRGPIWVTDDGTSAIFIANGTIGDSTNTGNPSGPLVIYPSGLLIMRDGTRYAITKGQVMTITDRNGNMLSFQYEALGRVQTITDSLGRQVTVQYATSMPGTDTITYMGFGGKSRQILINHDFLGNVLRPDYGTAAQTYGALFPELATQQILFFSPTQTFNPSVASSVVLPNGTKYYLYYNPYGELARVVLPTGGGYEYDHGPGPGGDPTTGVAVDDTIIYRRLTARRTYKDSVSITAGTPESITGYAASESATNGTSTTTVTHKDGVSGVKLAEDVHIFSGSVLSSFTLGPTSYSNWMGGKEIETDVLDPSTGNTLRVTTNTFTQNTDPSWFTAENPGNHLGAPAENPHLTQTNLTLSDTGQMSEKTFVYDQYSNMTDESDYDYGVAGSGTAGALLQHTRTTFLTDYAAATNLHIQNLPATVTIDGGGGTLAEAQYTYDSYPNQMVNDCPGISGHDPGYPTTWIKRGNPTSIIKGLGNDATTITMQYDIAGNAVSVTDGTGNNTTTISYTDDFGTPDPTQGFANRPPSGLGGQSSFAYPTMVTNPLGFVVNNQYDYATGRPVKQQDPNGVIRTLQHDDILDRPSTLTRADGTDPAKTQVQFAYDDIGNRITASSDLVMPGDGQMVGFKVYDGLGRTIHIGQVAPEGTITTDQTYDGLGRGATTSNPYISQSVPTYGTTTTIYDALSRVKQVQAANGGGTVTGTVSYAYSGNVTTTTIAAGNAIDGKPVSGADQVTQRTFDALGRLTRVIEDPSGLAYQTTYLYDALGNPLRVTQGVQTRIFTYDSLSRLRTAVDPERVGTTTYTYDADSNLHTKLDPNGVTTTYTYDGINRVSTKTYTDGVTPGVAYVYDTGVGKGRLASVTTAGVSTYQYTQYDSMNRPTAYNQQVGGVTYTMTDAYNLAGLVTNEKYPSGKIVHTDYDIAGRPIGVSDSATGAYYAGAASGASAIAYTPHGGVKTMPLGNGLIEQTGYNSRLQPTMIQLGTATGASDVLELDYDYGDASGIDNGNILTQEIKIGAVEVGTQSYSYDGANRILSAQETQSGAPVWTQNYGYDQFGNMATTHSDILLNPRLTPTDVSAATFNPATNRLVASSYDNNGNQKVDGDGSTFLYDAENRQTSCTVSNCSQNPSCPQITTDYSYDGDGQRVMKSGNGTTVTYVYNASGQMVAEYGGPATNGGISYLTTDHLGSTRVVTGGSAGDEGAVLARYDYQPFGDYIPATFANRAGSFPGYNLDDDTRQRFTSKERDLESALDYFGARYYSSGQGRFTSADTVGGSASLPQTFNLYSYVNNNPLRYVDPTGHSWQETETGQLIENENTFTEQEQAAAQTLNGQEVPDDYEVDKNGALRKKGGGSVVQESLDVSAGSTFNGMVIYSIYSPRYRNQQRFRDLGEYIRTHSDSRGFVRDPFQNFLSRLVLGTRYVDPNTIVKEWMSQPQMLSAVIVPPGMFGEEIAAESADVLAEGLDEEINAAEQAAEQAAEEQPSNTSGTPKDRTLDGTLDQAENAEKNQTNLRKIRHGEKMRSIVKSQGNAKSVLKRITQLSDVEDN